MKAEPMLVSTYGRGTLECIKIDHKDPHVIAHKDNFKKKAENL